MKGMVFTEFLEMVEAEFGLEIADDVLLEVAPSSGGAYTSVATYDHRELLDMVVALANRTQLPLQGLVRAFGKHLFGRLSASYPHFVQGHDNSFEFLSSIEDVVHVEVRKLYPDAELPSFEVSRPHPDTLEMIYSSSRPFSHLAEGLILGCLGHFDESAHLEHLPLGAGDGTSARFVLTRQGSHAQG